jgi:hypothetical protein
MYLRADKAQPNVFTAIAQGEKDTDFFLYTESTLRDTTYPFVSFDVMSVTTPNGVIDVIVGPTLGTAEVTDMPLGLPLQLAIYPGKLNSPILTSLKNVFLYSVVIDPTRTTSTTLYYYAVGWRYTNETNSPAGLIVLRGKGFISGEPLLAPIPETDIQVLDPECYDVWTEITIPKMYISNDGKHLIVAVMGRCDSIFRFVIPDSGANFKGLSYVSYDPPFNSQDSIDAVAYSRKDNLLYFSIKVYNTDIITFNTIDLLKDTLEPGKPFDLARYIESTPIMAIDEADGALIIAHSGFNTLERYTFQSRGGLVADILTGVLPTHLKHVSEIVFWGDYIYLTTWEPDAQLSRIPIELSFCADFCSENGYCMGGVCMCIPEYSQDPNSIIPNCIPNKLVQEIVQYFFNIGAKTSMGILFFLALIFAAAGWFVWYRKTHSESAGQRLTAGHN